jgi:hypothetical protein
VVVFDVSFSCDVLVNSEFELRTESGRWRILFFFFIILWRTCTVETEVAAVEAGSISDV